MQPAPPPANEEQRLAALRSYNILDTLPEQAYDDISLVAAQICGCPIALVSLVDEHRQWFKSKVGLDASETPRDIAFCSHAILDPEQLLVVEDARTDKRFHDNPLVTQDPSIRFYAGAPLVTADGMGLGTLCVIDRQPRQLSSEEHTALRALSRQVIAQLELRVAVTELEASRELLADSNADLERFAYVAAHDLKAPLRHIKGFAELLRSELGDQLDAEKTEYIEFITSSADRGQRLIDDILAYSRLESVGEPQPVLLHELLNTVCAGLVPAPAASAIEYAKLPAINGDPGQLHQLFENLVGNALKYNQSDEPNVRVESGASDGGCWVTVSDNGIGIPEEHRRKVFDMFSRVHSGSDYQGSGIGLAICKRVMELHEGTIEVSAAAEGGSTFTCWFPTQRIVTGHTDATDRYSTG